MALVGGDNLCSLRKNPDEVPFKIIKSLDDVYTCPKMNTILTQYEELLEQELRKLQEADYTAEFIYDGDHVRTQDDKTDDQESTRGFDLCRLKALVMIATSFSTYSTTRAQEWRSCTVQTLIRVPNGLIWTAKIRKVMIK